MNTKYTITENDYIQASKLHLRLTKKRLFANIFSVVFILVLIFSGNEIISRFATIAFLGATTAIIFLRYVLHPIMARRNYRNYPAIKQEFEIELEESGIKISTQTSQSQIMWKNIIKWREGEKYILVYLMPSMFNVIPKSLESSGFEISKLKEYLQENVGNAT